MRLLRLAAVPVALGVALTTACSGENTGELNITPLPVADINERPRDQLTTGGELRVPVTELGTSLNPLSSDASPEMDEVRRAFLPTLFDVSSTGEVKPNPNFLTDAKVTSPPGSPTTVTLTLNPDAKWGNGDQVTAEDVVATWRACNGQTPENRCREGLGLERIRDIVATSPTEAQVSFNEADPDWAEVFAHTGIVRASSVSSPTSFNDDWKEVREAWVSGPYVPTSVNTEHGVISMEPNDSWWGEEPPLERLTVVERNEGELDQAFAKNDVDVLEVGTSPDAFTTGQENPDAVMHRSGGTEARTLVFNTQSAGPVSDQGVRTAIALTLDRSRVGTEAMPGIDHTAAALDNRVFRYGQEGYVDNAETTEMTRDVRKARKALDAAGWKTEGDGTRSRDGQPLEIAMVRVTGDPVSEHEFTAISQQLNEVGIKVVPEDIDVNSWADGAALGSGTFQMAAVTEEQSVSPTSELPARFAKGGARNWSKLSVPEIETALEELNAETDPARRRGIANRIDELAWTHMGTLPLYQVPETTFTRSRLANYGANGIGTVDWSTVGYVK